MTSSRYICLVGFMGSGKSTVASQLNQTYGTAVLDSDHSIEVASGQSISELFNQHGEPYFRQLETNFLKSLPFPTRPTVLSTGGGMPLTPENVPLLKQKCHIVFLDVSFDILWARIEHSNRPIIAQKSRAEIQELFQSRHAKYRAISDQVIAAGTLSPLEISDLIWKNYTNVIENKHNLSGNTATPVSIPISFQKETRTQITIGSQILSELGEYLKTQSVGKKCVLISNPAIRSLYGDIVLDSCRKAGFETDYIDVPQGEKFKSFEMAGRLLDYILSNRFERKDTIIALGGGVIGDLAGFVASIYLRGINVIQIPTSLLAQVDASIGGKTGVNHSKGKNLIGSFYQPLATWIDIQTLQSLPQRELRCGLAEIVKYGIIMSPKLFDYLDRHASQIKSDKYSNDPLLWTYLVTESVQCKAEIVAKDEKESGLREILNFGHTIGHGIEAAFEYSRYSHGEAVAFGIKAASWIAVQMSFLSPSSFERILSLMDRLGFFLQLASIPSERILKAMMSDKKIRNGTLRFVLPTEIGAVTISNEVPESLIKSAIQYLME